MANLNSIIIVLSGFTTLAYVLKHAKRLDRKPTCYLFPIVASIYTVVCGISTIVISSQGISLAETKYLTDQQTLMSSLAWATSLFLSCYGYILVYELLFKTNNRLSRKIIICYKKKLLLLVHLFLFILFIVNPFRHVDYGYITASSRSELIVGGGLISGIIMNSLALSSLMLLNTIPKIGLPFYFFSIFLQLQTGSKGSAFVYVALSIPYLKNSIKQFDLFRSIPFHIRMLGLIALFLALLVLFFNYSMSYRFSSSTMFESNIFSVLSLIFARFSLQDVFTHIFSVPEAYSHLRQTYLVDLFTGSLPGFLISSKPINPAYEIAGIYTNWKLFTAATPGLYGSLLLLSGNYLLFPASFIVGSIIAFIEFSIYKKFTGSSNTQFPVWISVVSISALFEVNIAMYVATSIIIIAFMRYLFTKKTFEVSIKQ